MVGRRVENNLNNGKDMWHGFSSVTGQTSKVKGLFKSAKQFVKRKMKIPESGVW